MDIAIKIKESMQNYMTAKTPENKRMLDTYKMIKQAFMEYVTNVKNCQKLVKDGVFSETITTDEKGEEIHNINEDVSERIKLLPEEIQQKILEDMVKERKNNVETYSNNGREDLAVKENEEKTIIEALLPKTASEEDIIKILNEKYPDGIQQKQMGDAIKNVRSAFSRVDGKLVSELVKKRIV